MILFLKCQFVYSFYCLWFPEWDTSYLFQQNWYGRWYGYAYARGYKRNFECPFKYSFLRRKKLNLSYLFFDSRPKFGTTGLLCIRIHPVLGHPVVLFIPDDVAGMGLLGELILTPAAALCPCPRAFSNHLSRISSVSISFWWQKPYRCLWIFISWF